MSGANGASRLRIIEALFSTTSGGFYEPSIRGGEKSQKTNESKQPKSI